MAKTEDVHLGDPKYASGHVSLDWKKVTCKKCLKSRPKEKK